MIESCQAALSQYLPPPSDHTLLETPLPQSTTTNTAEGTSHLDAYEHLVHQLEHREQQLLIENEALRAKELNHQQQLLAIELRYQQQLKAIEVMKAHHVQQLLVKDQVIAAYQQQGQQQQQQQQPTHSFSPISPSKRNRAHSSLAHHTGAQQLVTNDGINEVDTTSFKKHKPNNHNDSGDDK